jgi:hypothetical protein
MKSFVEREKGFEAEFKRIRNWLSGSPLAVTGCSDYGRPPGWACLAARRRKPTPRRSSRPDFEAPGDADVIAKVQADCAGKGITATEAELRRTRARRRRSPPAAL